jgi:hypothetical protein
LLEIVRILNLPDPDFSGWSRRCVLSFSENKAQGVVFAHDDVWFLSSKDTVFRFSVEGSDLYQPTGVHRVSRKSRNELVQEAGLDGDDYVHIGGLGYLDGLVFVPIENKDHNAPWLLLGITEELRLVGYSFLPRETRDAFVAINPWNRLLYVSSRSETNHLYAYDASEFLQLLPYPQLYGALVCTQSREERNISLFLEDDIPDDTPGPQGISFSEDGYIFLSWWRCTTRIEDVSPWDPLWWLAVLIADIGGECVEFANHIRVYNALTGVFLYERKYDFEGTLDEIEGLSVHPSGVLYVAVCRHDLPDEDEFEIHAFQ